MFILEYKLKGDKYTMKTYQDKDFKDIFIRDGFHVVDLKMKKDPVNG